MDKSTHKAEVVPVVLENHPNADSLSIVKVFGYTCCVRTEDWVGITKAVYIPPDSLVDVRRPEFAFLAEQARADGYARVKAKKLRGVLSFGLLVPAPDYAEIGDNLAVALDVQHYEPPISVPGGHNQKGGLLMGGETCSPPNVYVVKYDLDAGRRYNSVFREGEPVVITEKIHGANARYVFCDGQMYCGSRTEWKKEYPNYDHITIEYLEEKVGRERAEEIYEKLRNKPKMKNLWWQALDATPGLRQFCEANPKIVVYGEVYGAVQDLNYGHKKGEVSFAAFDIMQDGHWVCFEQAYRIATAFGVPWVPLFNKKTDNRVEPIPFDFDMVCELAEGPSLVSGANHVREGVVVRPYQERWDKSIGRVCLKWVGAGYLGKV